MEDVTEQVKSQQQAAAGNGNGSEVREQIDQARNASEMLRPATHDVRYWKIEGLDGDGQMRERVYAQEVLSYFGKQDFYSLMTDFFDRFISGEFGVKVKDLWESDLRKNIGSIPTQATPEEAQRLIDENIEMIRAFFKVIQRLPGLQQEILLLALGVPEGEQNWAKQTMSGPLSRGGLDDDTAFDMLKTFISQNAQPIKDFFVEKGADLLDHARKEILGEDSETSEEEQQTKVDDQGPDTPGGTPSSTIAPSVDEIH